MLAAEAWINELARDSSYGFNFFAKVTLDVEYYSIKTFEMSGSMLSYKIFSFYKRTL